MCEHYTYNYKQNDFRCRFCLETYLIEQLCSECECYLFSSHPQNVYESLYEMLEENGDYIVGELT